MLRLWWVAMDFLKALGLMQLAELLLRSGSAAGLGED